MSIYNFSLLNPSETYLYDWMTYPLYRSRLQVNKLSFIAVKADVLDQPIGLALAEIEARRQTANLLSVYTITRHRRKGAAAGLIHHVESELRRCGCKTLKAVYETNRANTIAVEGMLRKCKFPEAKMRALVCRCYGDRLKQSPWMKKSLLPSAFEIFLWKDLTDNEKQSMKESRKRSPWYSEQLSPFNEEDIIEPLNSIGLRYKGEVAGWMITHRIAEDTIRYTSIFVRDDLQKYGLSVPLLIESIKRHIKCYREIKADKATFVIPLGRTEMINFVKNRMSPYINEINKSVETVKTLEGR